MDKRPLGKSGISVAPLAFGGNVFGWTADEKTSNELLDQFVDKGFNLIDTANSYSRWVPGHTGGESEKIIGKWLKQSGKRDQVIIATKVGSDMGLGKPCLKKEHILEQVEASLKRLNIEQIDLYQEHFDDTETPVAETLEAFASLIKDGKVKYIGASNITVDRLNESLKYSEKNRVPGYITLQPEYNLYTRKKFEEEFMPVCKNNDLGVLTYFSLASGFLTGKYRTESDFSKSMRGGGMSKYMTERGFRIVNALDKIAFKHDVTPAAIALAWLQSRPTIIAPIASATNSRQLDEILKSVDIKLDGDISELDKASS